MKKVLSLMVCSLLAIGLVGCGEGDTGINGDENGVDVEDDRGLDENGTMGEDENGAANGGAIQEEPADQLPGQNQEE